VGLRIVERLPTPTEYRELRASAGWNEVPTDAAARGLAGSLYSVCAEADGRTVGCARVVGDGGLYFYLQDVIVLPAYQGRGVGAALMRALLGHLARSAPPGAFVGLMAAAGASAFYRRYGFAERPEGRPGMFRIWTAGDASEAGEG
jgi:ribosomal protein S18 acetylase RimI-like enzyme